ncbi:MAG TPA: glycosyltransferase [Cyclobacteriaceae bacterium]
MKKVEVKPGPTLNDYESYASLYATVKDFKDASQPLINAMSNRKIWMINSTATGGGVAEMLHPIIRILDDMKVNIEWQVIETSEQKFFDFTKNLHNLIHGKGNPALTAEGKEVYDLVNKENGEAFADYISDGDIVIIHDPQPMGMARYLKDKKNVTTVWRCHIGLDLQNESTIAAWDFLKPYFDDYDHSVFTSPEYVPQYLDKNSVSIITPAIDPFSNKNMEMKTHTISGILHNAGIIPDGHPYMLEPFMAKAQRVQYDGSFDSALLPEDIGLLFRPIITQVSRWDRLKGFEPLMKAFAHLKQNIDTYSHGDENHRKRIDIIRLVLAGPDPSSVKDDPEGQHVLTELINFYTLLDESIARDIAILLLPMESPQENALIVNALQRCSTIVAQNSLQEGFGLTVTEAMWKITPILGSMACGLRHQIRNGVDGQLVKDAEDTESLAQTISDMIREPIQLENQGYSAQRRAIDEFLVFSQLMKWGDTLAKLLKNR